MSLERRTKARYPLELTIHYQTMGVLEPICGAGRTVNMSSSGLLIACEHDLPEGERLKVTIEWPTLLNGTTPLQLVTTGKVVRKQESNLGVAFDWYQFRTMRRTSASQPAVLAAALAAHASLTPTGVSRGSLKSVSPDIRLRNAG